MKNQIVSEIRKLQTTRTTWGLLIGLIVLVGVSVLEMLINIPEGAFDASRLEASPLAAPTAFIVTIFAVVAGVRSFTDEFRFGAIVPTLLATPARRRVVAGKLVALAIVGCILAVAAATVALCLWWLVPNGFDIAMSWTGIAAWTAELAVVAIAWTAIGIGIGLAIKHQVAAVVGSLVWVTILDGILGSLLPDVAVFLPSAAGRALVSVETGQLDPINAAFVLAAWVVAVLGIGAALMRTRDITGE